MRDCRHERLDDLRVEVRSGAAAELVERHADGACGAVRTIRRDRAEGVASADDPRCERDLLAREAVGIARPVPVFVTRTDDPTDVAEDPPDL